MHFPHQFEPFKNAAETLITLGNILDIEFSGCTYQILVKDKDSEKAEWVFLQLNNRGQPSDFFCGCNGEGGCSHVAAAYLVIYRQLEEPLHMRFEQSLWHQLTYLFFEKYDLDTNLKKLKDGKWGIIVDKKEVFGVDVTSKKKQEEFQRLFYERPEETETTSIKFSNLSQDELEKWQEGRPSLTLKYELSFWSDLAKRWMLWQDRMKPYQIHLSYDENKIPNKIEIEFPDATFRFHITIDDLSKLIPSFATVTFPLKVQDSRSDVISSIRFYDGKLFIDTVSESAETFHDKISYTIAGWDYVPQVGFYSKGEHPLVQSKVLEGKEIAKALNHYYSLIKKHLAGCKLSDHPISLSYHLFFDDKWNLMIEGYLKNPGDLTAPGSYFWGDWAYLPDKGMIPLSGAKFDRASLMIPCESVSEFVLRERAWLSLQQEFITHLHPIEIPITYEVKQDGSLEFYSLLDASQSSKRCHDFKNWIYIEGKGFFPKKMLPIEESIPLETPLTPNYIPAFIQSHAEELQFIQGFFTSVCPIAESGLDISCIKDSVIVHPYIKYFPEFEKRRTHLYEDYVYTQDEGFYELPAKLKLPERYQEEVKIKKKALNSFIKVELRALKPYVHWIDPKLIPPKKFELNIEKVIFEDNFYRLTAYYVTENGKISAVSLYHAMKKKEHFLFDDAGLIDLEAQELEWLRELNQEQVDLKNELILLSTIEFLRLNAWQKIEKTPDVASLLSDLQQFHAITEPDMGGLKGKLRPYQTLGVKWLWTLFSRSLSGLLCDDMGLGKTHQAMALMSAINNQPIVKNKTPYFLIICPTSVIYHWQEKLEEYLPGCKVFVYHGAHRCLQQFPHRYQILLTSYGIWRNEQKWLSQIQFACAFFDEIQISKNSKSHIHQALKKVQAKMKVGLTGTPIENRLEDLKALFDLVLPGYLPKDAKWKHFFQFPIEKENSDEKRKLLSRLIQPFILRRKKGEVLLDLPPKIEEIYHCDLLDDQKKLYKDALKARRDSLMIELSNKDQSIPYLHIFSLLTRLKQICDHPAVFLKTPELYKNYSSGKWDLFCELLSEARASEQKVVVYSQYLFMLDIIELYLQEENISFASIRGATRDRKSELIKFKKDPECEVFVGSLQAIGLGVDLTSASCVIHYDRWWNAARENQATDRVHRIGQTRGVEVFKLVTKGTFEERIDQLISKKARLMEHVIHADDHTLLKSFNREELIQLLELIESD